MRSETSVLPPTALLHSNVYVDNIVWWRHLLNIDEVHSDNFEPFYLDLLDPT